MPRVEIQESSLGPAVSADVPAGERLLDLCDRLRAPVSFSCRSATCGTCIVAVREGQDLLDPPAPAEREILALFAAAPDERLACQAVIRPGPGLVRVAWVEPVNPFPE